jgi:hypothetical protein
MRVAKLRRPFAVRKESRTCAFIHQIVKDLLQQLSGAEPSLVKGWIGVSRESWLSHRYSSEWIGSPFSARAR